MLAYRFRHALLTGVVCSLAAITTGSGVAQTEPLVPEVRESREVTPNAPAARQDVIDAYQVRVAESDYLAGRLQVVDSLTGEIRGVRKTGLLFVQNGKVVGRGETGVSGVAQIKSLPVGAYSAIALGPDGMAAFGFEILPPADGVAVAPYRFDAIIVPAADMSVAQRSICSAGPFASATPLPSPAPPAPASALPVALTRQDDDTASRIPAIPDPAYDTFDTITAPLKGQPILLQNGGTGSGQLVILAADGRPAGLENARVSFLRAGKLHGTVETDSRGHCGIVGLEDGVYSMVGVGSNGFIALGVRVKTVSASASTGNPNTSHLISTLQTDAPVVGWRIAGATSDALAFAPGFACGACGRAGCCGECAAGPCGGPCDPGVGGGYTGFGGGGFGGGFGGGGGGFFGGGLLGPLLGAGVGAAIGAAVANDDDEGGGGGMSASPNSPPSGG